MPVTSEQREVILKKLRDGYDLEVILDDNQLDLRSVKSDRAFMAECGVSFSVGTAKIREKLLKSALTSGSEQKTHILERIVERREAQQRAFPAVVEEAGDDGDVLAGLSARLKLLGNDALDILERLVNGDEEPLREWVAARARKLAAEMVAADRPQEEAKIAAKTDRRIEARRDGTIVDLVTHRRL
jgi:hypothetical protein